MNWILENSTQILAYYGAFVVIATGIVKATPTQKDDSILEKILKVLDYFSTALKKEPTK